jgi:hypothetical protein
LTGCLNSGHVSPEKFGFYAFDEQIPAPRIRGEEAPAWHKGEDARPVVIHGALLFQPTIRQIDVVTF